MGTGKNSKVEYDTKTEMFECDCHSRGHIIIARRDVYIYSSPTWPDDMDISMSFETMESDSDSYYILENPVLKFCKASWWRIKKAFNILLKGEIYYEGSWMPARLDDESLVGCEETKRLGNFLIESAEILEKFYKEKQINILKSEK
jgi:hypothetical protein